VVNTVMTTLKNTDIYQYISLDPESAPICTRLT